MCIAFHLNKIYWSSLIKAKSHREAHYLLCKISPLSCRLAAPSLSTEHRGIKLQFISLGTEFLSKVRMVKHPRGALNVDWWYRHEDVRLSSVQIHHRVPHSSPPSHR
jgi:hypothetical protein